MGVAPSAVISVRYCAAVATAAAAAAAAAAGFLGVYLTLVVV